MLTDERRDAAQIAHKSNLFSLSREKNFKVYSYINTSVVDVEKREGFFAVRLFTSSSEELENAKEILLKIAEKYKNYVSSNSLANQDYSDIISTVLLKKENILAPSTELLEGNYYLYVDDVQTVDQVFKKEATFFVKKLYIFDKSSTAQDASVAQQLFGMKSLVDLEQKIKTITVNNPDSYLSTIKINGNEVKIPPTPSFKLLLLNSDIVKYKNQDDKKEKDVIGYNLDVHRPQPVYKPQPLQQSNHNRKGFSLGSLLAASIATLIIGSAVSWFFTYDHYTEKIALIRSEQPEQVMAQSYYFSLDPSIKDFTLLGNNISGISSYKFKYSDKDKKWTYTDGNALFNNLDSRALNEIARKGSLNEEEFKNALEKISGRAIDLSKKTEPSVSGITEENSSKIDVSTVTASVEKKNGETKSQTTPQMKSTKTFQPVAQQASKTESKNTEAIKPKQNRSVNKAVKSNSDNEKLDNGSSVNPEKIK
jgi:hypothetical protein